MINHISIKDFAIIDNIDIDLYPGLNIITGETGSGKSIIIEAVSLALGSRADTTMVRSGHEKALIQIQTDDDTVITREISSSGKSLVRINGRIVTLSELSEFTAGLADIHGQYDHQSLLNPDNHILLLDESQKDKIEPLKKRIHEIFSEYTKIKTEYQQLIKSENDAKREIDFLKFEIDEIQNASPVIGEDEELEELIKIQQNGEKIFDRLSTAYSILSDQTPSLMDELGTVQTMLREISDISVELDGIEKTVSQAFYDMDEATSSIREQLDSMDFSKDSLNRYMTRLDILDRLKSKYGGSIENVLKHCSEAIDKLDKFENIDDTKMKLESDLENKKSELFSESMILSNIRKLAATDLESKVVKQLEELNFNDAQFKVNFDETIDIEQRISNVGYDRVEFLLSANKGQPPLPLAKIASGGEMSRIMLAMKTVTGDHDTIPTLIFDEIDSGISGVTASIVGEKLKEMSKSHQIICITHLPQIAAVADHHYVINKNSDDDMTYTTIEELDDTSRIDEIARLLGGKNITEKTLASAKEMLDIN